MTAHKGNIALCLTLALLLILAASPVAEAKNLVETRTLSRTGPALLGSPDIDTTQVYYEDFSDTTGGWVPKDLMVQDAYWHQTTYDDGSGTVGVMWCGLDEASWGRPPGYGTGWGQYLSKSFVLVAAPLAIDYRIQYDTEGYYDFVYLDVSTDGGTTYTTLRTYGGNSGGFQTVSTDLSAYAGQTALIRFRFVSDSGWDDEDGYWDTDGAARLDWVQVTGHPRDDFETGDDGWVAQGRQPSAIQFRLEETPVCDPAWPCPGYTDTWVAYDPATGQFPFEPDGLVQRLAIESPAIDIPTGASNYVLDFDLYCNLPDENLVYFDWEVAGPPPEQGGIWRNDRYVTVCSGGGGFHDVQENLTPFIEPDATQVRVRLEAYALPGGATHTAAPMFDNVGVYAIMGGPLDTDEDGVITSGDLCPDENASFFDNDGDGCVDEFCGGRRVEFWDRGGFPVTYFINESGASGISDGSEFQAIQDGMNAWTLVPGVDASVTYGGTIAQSDAQALDRVNLVTFTDQDYQFGIGVLAVEITTSFTEPTEFEGELYRPGEIIDADMIFNPAMSFRTVTDGPLDGTYIEAVATHEAGHFFGLSHSAVRSATMYFVLQPGMDAATLEPDDEVAMFSAYGEDIATMTSGVIRGQVWDGYTGQPVAGAAVFAISATTGDTVGCEYTFNAPGGSWMGQGRFSFSGLPYDQYYLALHPLDGSSAIGYMEPAYVNDLIAGTANTNFPPDWWDSSEPSSTDDPSIRTPLPVDLGFGWWVTFRTNIDAVHPEVISTVPALDATDVSVGTSVMVSFSEPIDETTLQGNFSLTETVSGEFVPGNAAILNDGSLVAFVPEVGLAFSSTYRLGLDTGLEDRFGNGLSEPFEMFFTTEAEPPVALTSLAPSKGVAGIVVSVNGKGFDPLPANNTVTFAGVPAVVSQASPTQLVVTVPDGATSGVVNVYNHTQDLTSNDLQFTVLSPEEVPRGFDFAMSDLGATPRALDLLPDGSYAYLATDAGARAVVVDPALAGYMTGVVLPISGGLSDIAACPAGNLAYAVSNATEHIYRIDTTPASIGVLSEKSIGAIPRGILIHPRGHRAFIPTYDGDIQIWDLDDTSPTFESQIGVIISPDPNLRGKMATDPAGDLLMALAGTGKLLVFSLDSYEVEASIAVGPDPKDVAVDPGGERAYVCDGTGLVTVVSLTDYVCLQTIRTGGSLWGISITPAGTFAHVVNRELNLLEAIDLRETSPTFRTTVATLPLPTNPVAIELSPDGDYAFTISEAEERLVVTTIGLGPSLATISPSAGPVGSRLAIAGSDFLATSSITVSLGGISADPDLVTEGMLTVTVPPEATSGKISVVTTNAGEPALTSNTAYFEVLSPSVQDQLRLAAVLPGTPAPSADGGSVLEVSPSGDLIALADNSSGFHVLMTDPSSPEYHKYIGSVDLGWAVEDIVIAPDCQRAFVSLPGAKAIRVIGINHLRSDFLSTVAAIDFSGIIGSSLANVAISPDGALLLAADPGTAQVHLVDAAVGSSSQYEIVASVDLASGDINGVVREMAFHPGCEFVYLPVEDSDPAVVLVLDSAPASPTYGTVVSSVALPGAVPQEVPISLAFTPDGTRCLVLTSQEVDSPNRSVIMLNTDDPLTPAVSTTLSLGGTAAPAYEHIDISPRGDRAIVNLAEVGLVNIEIQTSPDALSTIEQVGNPADHEANVGNGYAPDASRFYCLSESSESLYVYDFNLAQTIAILSGDQQVGVVNEPLPRALRVEVSGASGSPAGVPVTFRVTSGGGYLASTNSGEAVVVTDTCGIAGVTLVLGPDIGTGAHAVEAAAVELVGSPLVFMADGVADPTTLPLTVSAVVPLDGKPDVSIETAIQVTFSRALDPTSVTASTFFLHIGDYTPVPAAIGLADGNRKASISPLVPLEPNTAYYIEITTGILDDAGEPLSQAVTSSFTTEPPPPLRLSSIAPVSGPENIPVVLAGTGFNEDPSWNQVLFNDLGAYVSAGAQNFLNVIVPVGTSSGMVRVVDTAVGDTSNALTFMVLPPAPPQTDEVIASVSTGSGTHAVAITPDGAFAYAVSPDGNSVVVINLWRFAYVTTIPVGENPVAIVTDPGGNFAYVANYLDGTVSVIDLDRESLSHNQVVDVVPVGAGPRDIAVMPDGDRMVVVNSISNNLSVVDTDPTSETYRSVVASVSTASGTSTVAITPDGWHIYVGTANGYLVISTTDYGVVASVATGSGTSTLAITPDGAFLVLVTTEGVVNIYDIQEGGATQYQVVASIQTGSGTTVVAITPDGSRLYLIQGAGDLIFVVALSVTPGVGVVENVSDVPPVKIEATIVDTLSAGEDPAGIAIDPTGSGTFVVTNAGDHSISVFGFISNLAGSVEADCPQLHTGLGGVKIDVFRRGSGDLITTMLSDADGQFASGLQAGDYTVTLITPLGYTTDSEEVAVTLSAGETTTVSFELLCEATIPDPRKMSFWKHQVALAISGKGNPEVDAATLCDYLDLIEVHFNNNVMNPVVVYEPPASGDCMDKLQVAKDVMNLKGYREMVAFARQELLALLFNVASDKLRLGNGISPDGATVSMAITYVDGMIDDGITENDELARDIAKDLNQGKTIDEGVIPLDIPNIMYMGRSNKFDVLQNCPNPFNEWTMIQFAIPKAVHVRLAVYDVTGRLVRVLVDGRKKPDLYRVFWDGTDNSGKHVASGLYFYSFDAGEFMKTKKMIYLR